MKRSIKYLAILTSIIYIFNYTYSASNSKITKKHEDQHIKEIKDPKEFDTIIKSKGLKIIKYYSPYCGPCKQMVPLYTETAKKYHPKIKFYKLDTTNENMDKILDKQNIIAVPTIVFVKNGKEITRQRGTFTKSEIEDMANQLIKEPQIEKNRKINLKKSKSKSK
jgi:thioredoxin 1